MVFLKEVFTKVNFERKKISRRQKSMKNNPEAKGLIFLA